MTATSKDIRDALSRVADDYPDEVRVIRHHLDGLLVHPVVLAERAIRSTEGTAHELGELSSSISAIERHLEPILEGEAARLVLDVEERRAKLSDRKALQKRSEESGAWVRSSTRAIASWLGKRSEVAFALVLGALATWLVQWLGVPTP